MIVYKNICKSVILALGLLWVGYVDFGLVDLQEFGSRLWWFKVTGYIVLAVGIVWELFDEFPTPVKTARPYIEPILDAVSGCLQQMTETTTIRANIFLLDKHPIWINQPSIKIFFRSTNMHMAKDANIRLHKYQGLSGHVWGAGQAAVADLTIGQQKGWASWNLSPEQIDATNDLKAIFSTPIFEHGGRKIIGILSFDCDQEFFRSDPNQKRMIQFFENDDHFRKLADSTGILVSALLVKFKMNRELK